jgi:hypothetical protein
MWYWVHRNLGRTPRWSFPDGLKGPGVRLQRLHFDNYNELWPLLAQGDTTFIEPEYRECERLYEQVLYLYGYAPFSGKRGAVDYLIVRTTDETADFTEQRLFGSENILRLGEGEQLVGVVHLYDLSLERFGRGMPNPLVGIQLAEAFRGSGVADPALDVLEWYVRQTYDEARAVTAMIKRDNTRSIRFFARRGYAETDAYTNCERVVFRVKALEVEIT